MGVIIMNFINIEIFNFDFFYMEIKVFRRKCLNFYVVNIKK